MPPNPTGVSPERPGDPSRGALDPVTMEILHKYGMAADPRSCTPQRLAKDNLADFIGKYRLDGPTTEIKSGFIKESKGIHMTPTEVDLANTASLSSTQSSEDAQSSYLWKVKHDGAFLTSTSFSSAQSSEVNDNPTHMLRRLNLSRSETDNSSTSTEKITNHGSRYESPSRHSSMKSETCFSITSNFQAKLRDRLRASSFRPISTSPNVVKRSIRNASPKSERSEVNQANDPKQLAEENDPTPNNDGCITPSRQIELIEEDATSEVELKNDSTFVEESTKVNKPNKEDYSPHYQPTILSNSSIASCDLNEEQSALSKRSNGSYNEGGERSDRSKQSNGSYDESEFKLMTNITHSYQKIGDTNVKSSRVSAIPMSGIGVDLNNDFSDSPKVLTPREASTSCTLSSFVAGLFHRGQPETKKSALDIITSICSPLPENLHSPTIESFGPPREEKDRVGYKNTTFTSPRESDASDNEKENGTHLTIDINEEKDSVSDRCSVKSESSSEESMQLHRPFSQSRESEDEETEDEESEETEETTLKDDDTYATMSTLTSIHGGNAINISHRSSMAGRYASKRVYTPRFNGNSLRKTRYDEYDDNESQMTMSILRDDDTQATMSTLTYSKVGSLYGSNAIAGYHRGSMGGYYNRHIDAQGYTEDEWDTCSRLTTSTFGIGSKPYRPQNHTPNKSYNRRHGAYDRQFDIVRECSRSGSESASYDADGGGDTTVTSFTDGGF